MVCHLLYPHTRHFSMTIYSLSIDSMEVVSNGGLQDMAFAQLVLPDSLLNHDRNVPTAELHFTREMLTQSSSRLWTHRPSWRQIWWMVWIEWEVIRHWSVWRGLVRNWERSWKAREQTGTSRCVYMLFIRNRYLKITWSKDTLGQCHRRVQRTHPPYVCQGGNSDPRDL